MPRAAVSRSVFALLSHQPPVVRDTELFIEDVLSALRYSTCGFQLKGHLLHRIGFLKGALCNIFTGCKQTKNRVLDARNSSLQELT